MAMRIPVVYHPGFAVSIGEGHIMPIGKFALVAEALAHHPSAMMRKPEPISLADLARVHTAEYIQAVHTGEPRALAESQRFSWSPQLFPAVRLTNGGVLEAAVQALEVGIAACLASGFHHACADHGEGFCTFNGLIVTLDALFACGKIQRGAILDMDLHYGNGTAQLAASRPHVQALSIYGSDYWANTPYIDHSVRRHNDGENHHSAILPNGCNGAEMARIMDATLPLLLAKGKPDILLYQAGADPFREDPYSPLDLGFDDLKSRDQKVFSFCRKHSIPIAWVLAGGYTREIQKVVDVHVNTFTACTEVYL